MKPTKKSQRTTIAFTALALAACKPTAEVVRVDGSSTVFPIAEALAEDYQRATPGVHITIGVSGTGGGFEKFCRGETDLTNASRPIKKAEIDACSENSIEYIELPVAYDGLAVVVNPKNTWVDSMTVEELRRIWQPEAQKALTRWNQIRSAWPDREIHLFGPGVDSGTYDYFTEAVVGKAHSSRGDYTSSEDDNVLVQGIANDEIALGFFGLAYFEENRARLRVVPIDDGKPENGTAAIAPSAETVENGTYTPLSRPLFLYVAKGALERRAVAGFARAYIAGAAKIAREVGYVPLPARAYELARARLDARQTGTLFAGKASRPGASIETILAAQSATTAR